MTVRDRTPRARIPANLPSRLCSDDKTVRVVRLDDDKRLMDLRAKGASFNEIAIALGRTEAALEQRAHNLKRQAAAHYLPTPD